jgi:hypothetical protein
MIMRAAPWMILATLLLGACGTPDRTAAPLAAAPTAPAAEILRLDDRLYAGVAGVSPSLLALGKGEATRELPFGVRSPDGATLYGASTEGTAEKPLTRVQALDIVSGEVLHELSLEGSYRLPRIGAAETPGGLSPNGRWLVLEAPLTPSNALSTSRLVVLDTSFNQKPREVTIDGEYWFDGISNSGDNLYLIEYMDKQQRQHYRVRLYHVAARQLEPAIIADKRNGEQVMGGVRQQALPSDDGTWLFSLYLDSDHGPFIHALNLSDQYAICIDLPSQAKQDAAQQRLWALAMSANGNTLYAVNGGLGLLAEIGTAELTIRSVSSVPVPPAPPEQRPDWPGGAALASDSKNLYVIGHQGLLAIDIGDPKHYRTFLPDRVLRGLALSADGARLYAVDGTRGKIVQAHSASGALVSEIAGPGEMTGLLWIERAHS